MHVTLKISLKDLQLSIRRLSLCLTAQQVTTRPSYMHSKSLQPQTIPENHPRLSQEGVDLDFFN